MGSDRSRRPTSPPTSSLFQFTLPHGERQVEAANESAHFEFQFTLPHGERHPGGRPKGERPCFNSRSRMGSDMWVSRTRTPGRKFQFTLPHGERHSPRATRPRRTAFQFTLPHGERRDGCGGGRPRAAFQFTLPHGERPVVCATVVGAKLFQFTLPHGERRLPVLADLTASAVSIHAPAWGATTFLLPAPRGVSIHAPAWGATPSYCPPHAGDAFQFTLPHGERLSQSSRGARRGCFNSRSRMGSDLASLLPSLLD